MRHHSKSVAGRLQRILPLGIAAVVLAAAASKAPRRAPEPGEAVPPAGATLVAEGLQFPEGPAIAPDGTFYFSDVRANKILRRVDGKIETFFEGEGGPNGLAFAPDGTLCACFGGSSAVMRLDSHGKARVLCDKIEGRPLNHPNDLAFDRRGNLYFTNPVGFGRPKGAGAAGAKAASSEPAKGAVETGKPTVCLLRSDGSSKVIIDDLAAPNGIDFSPDGATLYVNDTRSNETRMYPVKADGTVGKLGWLLHYEEPGGPDGMAVAASGNLFVALNGAGKIAVVSPEGKPLREISFGPKSGVTNVCFGGKDLGTLYVTCGRAGKVFSLPASEPGAKPFAKP